MTVVSFAACDSSGFVEPSGSIERVEVNVPARDLVALNDTVRLTAIARDAAGHAADAALAWSVLDSTIASVDQAGLVTARANGRARVTVHAGTVGDTVAVDVDQQPRRAEITPVSVHLSSPGDTTDVDAAFYDANGYGITDARPEWSSLDPQVAIVDSAGGVRALAPGATKLIATLDAVADTADVLVDATVDPADLVVRVEISPAGAALHALGDTLQLNAIALDSAGATVAGVRFLWTSLNPELIMVDSLGRAVSRSIGTALITALAIGCGDSDTTGISIDQVVDSIAVTPPSHTLAVGQSVQLTATAYDANRVEIENTTFAWSSSSSNVVGVNSTGRATAASAGTATIRAAAGGVTGTSIVISEPQGTGTDLALEFSSYIGGSNFEQVRDVTTDAAGNVYIVGGTISSDFPVTSGAFQTIHNAGTPESTATDRFDVFVTKLSPSGTIIWSTYLGGPNYDRGYAVEVDAQGYVYVAGRAGRGFPVTAGAFQTAFQGGSESTFYGNQDGFICKLLPNGSDVVFCSYFGTSGPRPIRDIDIDANGDIYLASSRESGSFPTAVASKFVNSTLGGGDAVIAKVRSDGSAVLWARYLGGTGYEGNQNSVRVARDGSVYMLFPTQSSGIATAGAYDRTYGGGTDLFVTKLNAASGGLQWGGYIGGSGLEEVETHELALDSANNAIVAFITTSPDLPTTQTSYQGSLAGGRDIGVVKLSSNGSELLGSTYVGGSDDEDIQGIGVDRDGNVYFSGTTSSRNHPTTANAFRGTYQGGIMDIVAVSLSPDLSALNYATFFGGAGADVGRTAMVTGAGVFWFAGETSSSNWPVVNGAQAGFGGGTGDAVLTKFVR